MRILGLPAGFPLALLASLAGCTHFGTHIAGHFRCRTPEASCQPVSVVDAAATRELLQVGEPARTQPKLVASNQTTRTGERTLRVVFPAHVDESGVLHEDAVVWAVVEPARWAGELRHGDTPRSGVKPISQALRRIDVAPSKPTALSDSLNPQPLPPEDSVSSDLPFHSAASPVLPSPGGAADAGEPPPAAEGSDLPASIQDRTPRLPLTWPSAAAIDAAKAKPKTAARTLLPEPGPAPAAIDRAPMKGKHE